MLIITSEFLLIIALKIGRWDIIQIQTNKTSDSVYLNEIHQKHCKTQNRLYWQRKKHDVLCQTNIFIWKFATLEEEVAINQSGSIWYTTLVLKVVKHSLLYDFLTLFRKVMQSHTSMDSIVAKLAFPSQGLENPQHTFPLLYRLYQQLHCAGDSEDSVNGLVLKEQLWQWKGWRIYNPDSHGQI